ncbi:transforming protein p54/c-ets-1-like isoform X1 [Acropora muricata]|uniref:transforming protein p54/c-ets-1-like isoform X1 n=1 Tax=Acropora muricata TaxID=159855 RepID=UPI0034E46F39
MPEQFPLALQVEAFYKLSQISQLSMLHAANQPTVPEATPVPGFERQTFPMHLTSQDIASAFDFPQGRSYMDELMFYGPDNETVEELFNGDKFNEAQAISNFVHNADGEQLPDLSVFEDFMNEPFQSALKAQTIKEETKSPAPCDSFPGLGYSSVGSPPYSPSISEASSQDYSTDEGFQSDFEEILDIMRAADSPLPQAEKEEKKPHVVVKTESHDVTPPKPRKKRGPKPPVKYRGDGPIQLWQFLLELIIDPNCTNLIKWTHDEDYEFKILQPSTVAKMWGKKKNKPTMNYEKLSRGLRYYYGKSVIEKVHGKRYVYQFMCNIPKILGYDPMMKHEDSCEESVCGEPVMSPDVEDLLNLPAVEAESFVAGSLDFSALC